MFKKSMLTLSAVLLVATTIASAANAQTAPKGAGSFTAAEKLWFQIPEAADRMD
jgi:predicted small secreted protein